MCARPSASFDEINRQFSSLVNRVGCKEIKEHRIEIEGRFRTMMITKDTNFSDREISIFFFFLGKKDRFDRNFYIKY